MFLCKTRMRDGGSEFDIIYRVMKLYHNRKSDILDFDSISKFVEEYGKFVREAAYVTTCKSNFLCSYRFLLIKKASGNSFRPIFMALENL